jgi:plastocyanin
MAATRPPTVAVILQMVLRASALLAVLLGAASLAAAQAPPFYLPSAANSRIVSVAPTGNAEAAIVVLTKGVAIKETGPKETVDRFGEVYAFSPSFIAVRRGQPTEISFWNLQADDDHDLMLVDPHFNVLMFVDLPPLRKTSYVFTFHKEGLFPFYCTMHQPAMSGQILVLPPMKPQ